MYLVDPFPPPPPNLYTPTHQARQRLRDMAAMMKDYNWKVSEAQRANLIMVEENMTALENGVQARGGGVLICCLPLSHLAIDHAREGRGSWGPRAMK